MCTALVQPGGSLAVLVLALSIYTLIVRVHPNNIAQFIAAGLPYVILAAVAGLRL